MALNDAIMAMYITIHMLAPNQELLNVLRIGPRSGAIKVRRGNGMKITRAVTFLQRALRTVERFIECAREVRRWVADLEKLGLPAHGSS
jgi:hypothetical protein